MSVALELYEQLSDAADDQARFQLIAHAIGRLEEAWPRASEVATAQDVRESELRLQKEIEEVRKEIEALRGELNKDVEVVRGENKEMELRLQKEIKQVELQVQEVRVEVQEARVEIKATEASLRTAIHRQTLWLVGAVGAVVGFIRMLEWLFP
ncbi:MAG: DUF1640 domain-containing protein [Gammaproteobacteria bacterium]|jgi:predicted RNase H-like nuclease (RuvC/YqgF family)|nr:DUF1640 domain-containing protein [Gammaproteobacteria bacterium]